MKNFEAKLIEICKQRRSPEIDHEMLAYALLEITGELVSYIEIPNPFIAAVMIKHSLIDEDKKDIVNLYEGVIRDHNLQRGNLALSTIKGDSYYIPRAGEITKNTSLDMKESFLLGKGLVCSIEYCQEFPIIRGIYYITSAVERVKDIWIKYSELCFKISSKNPDETSKIYRVTTVFVDLGQYRSTTLSIKPTVSLMSDDFLNNYNSDLPEDRIKEFLWMDRGGIMIFNGKPGCGKSTYLKSLIFRYPECNFIIFPQYLLGNQEAFRTYLMNLMGDGKENIFIIEDCEQLLIKRDSNIPGFSSIIGDILNYTDGIFGDLTRTKFIFTFNTDLKNIDQAILRPGRLHLRYEFGPLKGDNLKKIATKTGYTGDLKNGVSLAELYSGYTTEDLQVTSRPDKRIGFTPQDIDQPILSEGVAIP